MKEIKAKFFRDCENTMSVNAGNKFAGHMKRTELIIFVTAGRTETAFTTKGNEFKITTMGTAIHGTAMGMVTTMNHLVDIFNDGRTRMEFINDMFVIVGEDGL